MASIDINDTPGTVGPGEGALAPLGQGVGGVPALAWPYGAPPRPEILTSKANPLELLYALRRRWLLAVSLGLLLGGFLAAVLWVVMPVRAEAAALLKILRSAPALVDSPPGLQGNLDFEVYKRTQAQLIKNHLVMQAVVRNPKVNKLPAIQAQKDPIAWLTSELMVDYPGEAEILRISMKGDNSDNQLITLVTEVKNAYMEEIVGSESAEKVRSKTKLETSVRNNIQEIETKSKTLHEMEKRAGVGDAAILLKRVALAELDELVRRRSTAETGIADLELHKAMAKAVKDAPAGPMKVTASSLEEAYRKDLDLDQLNKELRNASKMVDAEKRVAASQSRKLVELQDQIAHVREEIETRKLEIRNEREDQALTLAPDGRGTLSEEMMETQLKTYHVEKEQLDKSVQKALFEVNKIEETNSEIEAKRTEIHNLSEITNKMAHELKLWDLNMAMSNQRIVAIDDTANTLPTSDAVRKYVAVAFGGMLGFGLMLFGVAYLEFQSRRLNSSRDVNEGLGINVMGDLPPLSGRAWRRMTSGKGSPGTLQAVLAESIDNIRTTLIHNANVDSPHMVMVTSAEPQEGKTTVATQLAASLARSGHRTLLIDGDLRSPAAHRVFDLNLEPGLCEFLRGEAEAQAIIYPTHADNLWLLPAGRCDLRSVQALPNRRLGAFLDSLRSQFEFIIMDAGPVLTVADALLLGQHVDGAILSVLRNVSKVPKVFEAGERLRSVGIEVIGSVVNGVNCRPPRGVEMHLTEVEAS